MHPAEIVIAVGAGVFWARTLLTPSNFRAVRLLQAERKRAR